MSQFFSGVEAETINAANVGVAISLLLIEGARIPLPSKRCRLTACGDGKRHHQAAMSLLGDNGGLVQTHPRHHW